MRLDSALAPSADWPWAVLELDDESLIGLALAACARGMLPYWESRFPRDDKMGHLVSAMGVWAASPEPETQQRVLESLREVAVEQHGYLSPVEPVPLPLRLGSDCPGDFAGDSIVAAANAITEIGSADFERRARDCLEFAAQTVSQTTGHRKPDDEETDHWMLALERVRLGIIAQLKEWERRAVRTSDD